MHVACFHPSINDLLLITNFHINVCDDIKILNSSLFYI